jgi:hypothetical protein
MSVDPDRGSGFARIRERAAGATMRTKGGAMAVLWITLAMVFVLAVLAWVAYGLFEVSPFARHSDEFRDRRGKRRGDSPHLESRDDFERAHPA